jgi:hypothetical protein
LRREDEVQLRRGVRFGEVCILTKLGPRSEERVLTKLGPRSQGMESAFKKSSRARLRVNQVRV